MPINRQLQANLDSNVDNNKMNPQENYDKLRQLALNEGMALFGVADVKQARDSFLLPKKISSRFSCGISIGFRLSGSVLDTISDTPNQMYYFHYQRVNILLDQTALKITAFIQEKGYSAMPIPASQVIDWEKQLGSVSHREIAWLAGLGWYGRNNLIVNKNLGSQARYATILTDLPLIIDKPVNENCGDCSLCVKVCPARAIDDNEFNLQKCHNKIREFVKTQKIGQMICGVCLKVCTGSK